MGIPELGPGLTGAGLPGDLAEKSKLGQPRILETPFITMSQWNNYDWVKIK
jgi:hypothetical protein